MTTRDRIVIMAFATLAVLAAVWLLAVAPEREQAAKLGGQVSVAQAQLATAESQLSSARGAQARYESAYASIVSLGKAVPASREVPSLIYQLAQVTHQKNVEFASITSAAAAPGSTSTPTSASATASTGFTQMPFTFVFNGSFFDLYNLFSQLNRFTLRTASGDLQVSGRLLTIQSIKLAPGATSTGSGAGSGKSGSGSEQLTGTITATAYVLPAGQSLTGGATSAGPAGTITQTASTSSSSSAPSSANAPAVIQVTP
jgi:Tfp pilus assembly protein PilO